MRSLYLSVRPLLIRMSIILLNKRTSVSATLAIRRPLKLYVRTSIALIEKRLNGLQTIIGAIR
jgi:hypothetical protein